MNSAVARVQLEKLNQLLERVRERNRFYAEKWRGKRIPSGRLRSLEELKAFPLTTRQELLADQASAPPLGTNLGAPLSRFKKIYRSSATSGRPVYWADTPRCWQWVTGCSQALFQLAGIGRAERIFFTTSLGPSSGGWILYEGAKRLGAATLTSSSPELRQQLCLIEQFRPNVLVGKASRLLALGSRARDMGSNPRGLGIRKLILSGEPLLGDRRADLERLWEADCFNRYGMTEAGSIACECSAHAGGMHLLDTEFIAEVLCGPGASKKNGSVRGELVLTNLGRDCRPIIRYRTGDIVQLATDYRCSCGRSGTFLQGNVLRLNGAEAGRFDRTA